MLSQLQWINFFDAVCIKGRVVRRFVYSSIVVLLSLCVSHTFACAYNYTKEDLSGYNLQPKLELSGDSISSGDFSRNGHSVYFYFGYVYTYLFLSNSVQTLTSPTASASYVPDTVLASGYSGLEGGFGKEWGRYIDFQAFYLQTFSENKSSTYNGNSYYSSAKFADVIGDIGVVVNPDDRFQVEPKIGVALSEFSNSYTINNQAYSQPNDSTKINPAIGLDLLYQFTQHVGIRASTLYIADVQNKNSSGAMQVFIGLNYAV